jgi:large subunit ribosomal protein L24
MITKHQKAQSQQAAAQQQSGRIQKPAPIHVSNLQVVCPGCSKPTRVAHKEVEGRNVRVCKHCGETLDRVAER